MKKNQIITLAALGGIAVGGVLLRANGHGEAVEPSSQAQAPVPSTPVQATAPQSRSVSRLISLPGDVRPWEETTLYAKVPGYLGSISVDKGDRVKAGQVLATIQAPELQADRDQAQQTYQSALAAAQGSRATDERTTAEQQRARAVADKARADYAQTTVAIARAKAQVTAAKGAAQQAAEQKNQAVAALAESEAQVDKARADLEGARSDQKLADVTYERYQGIYDKNSQLLAKQDLDVAESRAKAARSRTQAAQSTVDVALRHVQAEQAQVKAAGSQIDQAQAQVEAALDQVGMMVAQQTAGQKQVEVAVQDVAISAKQQGVTQAKAQETRFQAGAGRSALGKTASVAEYARIHAPFSGLVTRRFVDRGAFIQTASTSQNAAPIVTIANLDAVRVYVNIPETEAGFIRVGTPLKISLTADPSTLLAARIARTTGSLDPKTRTLQVEADLPNHGGTILPGSYATAKVVLETHSNVLSVPSPAVGTEKAGKFVFVVEGGKAKRVGVTTGFNDGAYTEIQTGLHGGEQVVVTGRDALTPGAPVTVSAWTPPVKAVPGKK
jgi:RND family efflux transporter MFP subunit